MARKQAHLAYISGNPIFTIDSPSGYSTRIRELCKGFEGLGIKTSVHLPGMSRELIERAQSKKRKAIKSLMPSWVWETIKDVYRWHLDRRFSQKLIGEFSKGYPDIIYECLEYSGSVTTPLRRRCKGVFVLEIHGPLQEDARLTSGYRPLQFLFNANIKSAVNAADHIVVVSCVIADWLVSEFHISKEKIIVLPNGVNLHEFHPKEYLLPTSSKPTVIGFVGSDLVWHRLDALIEAMGHLPKELPVELHIAGLAGDNPKLKFLVKKFDLEHKIRFLGPVPYDQIPKVMSTFDIGVMPGSNRYGSPIKLFEYGAMGLAVIAPNEPPVREIFENGKDILLIPSGNAEKLKEAIYMLATDLEKRQKLGRAIQEKVRKSYGWTHIAKSIADQVGVSVL